METLPFVDDHARRIAAPPDRVWHALLATVRRQFADHLPRAVVAAWGLEHATEQGDWDADVAIGDTIVGFAVAERTPPRVLTLRGRHRFSRYELRFELDAQPDGDVVLHARTSAVFPGVLGRLYRALVIGTGGHRIVVRRMLAAVARRA